MSNNDKKWASNKKDQLLVENFRNFMKEGEFKAYSEEVKYDEFNPRHKLADDHKALQIVAWYLSQGTRSRSPYNAGELIDALSGPDAEEVFERYGITHEEAKPEIEKLVKDILATSNAHRNAGESTTWKQHDRKDGKVSGFIHVFDINETGDAIIYKGSQKA